MASRRTNNPAPPLTTNTGLLAFPRYLLPSLRIPFSRWRIPEPQPQTSPDPPSPTSSTSTSTSSNSAVPPLSTSPTSPTTPTTRRLSRARPDTLRCRSCATDLAFHTQIVSKCFQGRHGRAYLVAPPPRSYPRPQTQTPTGRDLPPYADEILPTCMMPPPPDLVNVRFGKPERRRLITGSHVVADVFCVVCGVTVGWKYVDAEQAEQAYKVGCFILETRRVVGCRGWEDVDGGGDGVEDGQSGPGGGLTLDGRPLGGGDEAVVPEGWASDWRGKWNDERKAVAFDSEDEDQCEAMFAGVWNANMVMLRRMDTEVAGRV